MRIGDKYRRDGFAAVLASRADDSQEGSRAWRADLIGKESLVVGRQDKPLDM